MASVRIVIAVFLTMHADVLALQVQSRTSVADVPAASNSYCSTDEQRRATLALQANQSSFIRGSPCLSDVAAMYEHGLEDVADAEEFLGTTEDLAEPGCRKHLLPSVLYLGMEHAGSSTMANLLNQHPHFSYGEKKEHRYWTKFGVNTFARNIDEYKGSFRVDCDVVKTFDATPNTFGLPLVDHSDGCHVVSGEAGMGAPGMKAVVEGLGTDTQLLVMVRNPVKVMMSRRANIAFEQNARQAKRFCECFVNGISAWMNYFPRKQFHFVTSEEFFEHPQGTLQGVLDFLGLDDYPYPRSIAAYGRRRSVAKGPTDARELMHYWKRIAPCQQRLETLTGLTLNWTKV